MNIDVLLKPLLSEALRIERENYDLSQSCSFQIAAIDNASNKLIKKLFETVKK